MSKYRFIFFVLVSSIVSCKSIDESHLHKSYLEDKSKEIIRIHQPEKVHSVFPNMEMNSSEKIISQQIFEGLFKYNTNTLALEKCLIKNFKIDHTNTIYTFELKDNVLFHKASFLKSEEERKLTSDDVLFCLQRLCFTDHPISKIIKNDKIFSSTDSTSENYKVSGLKKLSSTRFSIQLNKPSQTFLDLLAQPESAIYPLEMVRFSYEQNIQKSVGTGPFKMNYKNGSILLEKNEHYHTLSTDSNVIQRLHFIYESNLDSALSLFSQGKIDLIKHLDYDVLPRLSQAIAEGKSHIEIKHQPMLSIDFIAYNPKNTITADQNFRTALALSIDKKTLLNIALENESNYPATKGFSPQMFSRQTINSLTYHLDSLPDYELNIDSAKQLIQKVSFPTNHKKVTLSYIAHDKRHQNIATAFCNTVEKHLGIKVIKNPISAKQLKQGVKNNTLQLILKTYDYTYPNPLSFMNYLNDNELITSDSELFLAKANHTISSNKSMQFCLETEKQIIENHEILPLWSNEYYEVIQPDIENLTINALQHYDFRTISIREIERITPVN